MGCGMSGVKRELREPEDLGQERCLRCLCGKKQGVVERERKEQNHRMATIKESEELSQDPRLFFQKGGGLELFPAGPGKAAPATAVSPSGTPKEKRTGEGLCVKEAFSATALDQATEPVGAQHPTSHSGQPGATGRFLWFRTSTCGIQVDCFSAWKLHMAHIMAYMSCKRAT